jgi:hypothetical protein
LLETADGDVLTILDCCFASNSFKGCKGDTRTYELLAASPMDQLTPGPGENSFSYALCVALESLINIYGDRPFSTSELVQLLNHKRRNIPSMLWDRLSRHDHHIMLAPISRHGSAERQLWKRPKAFITLQFEIGDKQLSQGQVEELARKLPQSFRESNMDVLRIDVAKFRSLRTALPFPSFAMVICWIIKLRNLVRRRRAAARAKAFDLKFSGSSSMSAKRSYNEAFPKNVDASEFTATEMVGNVSQVAVGPSPSKTPKY